jgi:hypothetical protein
MTRPALSLDLADARQSIAAGERKATELGIPYNMCQLISHPRGCHEAII